MEDEAKCKDADDAPSPTPLTFHLITPSTMSRAPSSSPTPANVAAPPCSPSTADYPVPSPSLSCIAKKKRKSNQIGDRISVNLTKMSSLPNTPQKRPCMDLGKVICNELEDMSDMQRKLARKLIMDVIHLGSMDMLTMDHQLTQGVGSKQV